MEPVINEPTAAPNPPAKKGRPAPDPNEKIKLWYGREILRGDPNLVKLLNGEWAVKGDVSKPYTIVRLYKDNLQTSKYGVSNKEWMDRNNVVKLINGKYSLLAHAIKLDLPTDSSYAQGPEGGDWVVLHDGRHAPSPRIDSNIWGEDGHYCETREVREDFNGRNFFIGHPNWKKVSEEYLLVAQMNPDLRRLLSLSSERRAPQYYRKTHEREIYYELGKPPVLGPGHSSMTPHDDKVYINKQVAKAFGISKCEVAGCDEFAKAGEPLCRRCSEVKLGDYHDRRMPRIIMPQVMDSDTKIGFEVEKNDPSVKQALRALRVYYDTNWAIERDGSLPEAGGFEAISPVYNINATEVIGQDLDKLAYIIDAKKDSTCGGHINVSFPGMSSRNLLMGKLGGYMPLLYSLYANRTSVHYSQAKPVSSFSDDKYAAVRLRNNGIVELRIFPSPKNRQVLKWRHELLRIMINNPIPIDTSSSESVFDSLTVLLDHITDPEHPIFPHLSKVYNDDKQYLDKVNETIRMAMKFQRECSEWGSGDIVDQDLLVSLLKNYIPKHAEIISEP